MPSVNWESAQSEEHKKSFNFINIIIQNTRLLSLIWLQPELFCICFHQYSEKEYYNDTFIEQCRKQLPFLYLNDVLSFILHLKIKLLQLIFQSMYFVVPKFQNVQLLQVCKVLLTLETRVWTAGVHLHRDFLNSQYCSLTSWLTCRHWAHYKL